MPIRLLILLLGIVVLTPRALAAPGSLDPSFNGSGTVVTSFTGNSSGLSYTDARAYAVAVQPDGKILAVGHAQNEVGFDAFAIVRYETGGALDTSFNGTGRVTGNFNQERYSGPEHPWSMALQGDGKIVIGTRTLVWTTGQGLFALARYNSNGTLDTDFNGTGKVTTPISAAGNAFVTGVAIQRDGKIVACGSLWTGSSLNSVFAVARYMPNGTLDPTFNGTGIVTTAVGTAPNDAYAVALQADGKIIVVGATRNYPYTDSLIAVVRYREDGSLDTSFNGTGKVATIGGTGRSIAVQGDGKVLVAGDSGGGITLVRYTNSGALDAGFNGTGIVTTSAGLVSGATSVALQANGKIVVSAAALDPADFILVRYTVTGALDLSFNGTGKVVTDLGLREVAFGVAVQADGKIVAVGQSGYQTSSGQQLYGFAVARYDGGSPGDSDSDGLLDTWELSYWPAVAGHNALSDFDGDGVPELQEDAFGLNPTLPDAAGLPQAVNEGGYLTMTITKHAGVAYEVQSAGTLLGDQPDSFSPATTTVLINDAATLKVRDNALIGTAPARYLRVKVTAAP